MRHAILIAAIAIGCAPARVATPISSSHSQLTATAYDEAETAFAGGPDAVDVANAYEADRARCQRLLDQRDGLLWAATFGAALGAGGGLGAVLPEDASRDARLGVGISAAIVAAATAGFAVIAQSRSREFEEFCRTEKQEVTP